MGKSIVDALSKVDLFAINALSSKDVDLTDEGLVKSKLPHQSRGPCLLWQLLLHGIRTGLLGQ